MNIDNHSLINQNPSNTENGCNKISFGENKNGSEPSCSSVSTNILRAFMEEDRENATDGASEVNPQLTEHQPRSRIRHCKHYDSFRVHNCNDCLPPLETEHQFRIAVTRCARGGDSSERNLLDANTGMARDIRIPSPLKFKTKPMIVSSSPVMKAFSFAKAKGVEGRKTAAEVDAFFTRLSTPKYIKGKVLKEKKIGDRVQQMSEVQRRRYEATKGLCVNVVRTRSNSTVRSGIDIQVLGSKNC